MHVPLPYSYTSIYLFWGKQIDFFFLNFHNCASSACEVILLKNMDSQILLIIFFLLIISYTHC